MIFSTIGTEDKYDYNAPRFKTALAFLHRSDLAELKEGWYELENGVRASVQHYTTMDPATLDFETHEKYFDIQYLVTGNEKVGVCTRVNLVEKVPYAPDNDITFYQEPEFSGEVSLRAGDYVVLGPEDAHKPRCIGLEAMPVIKIVVKVPV